MATQLQILQMSRVLADTFLVRCVLDVVTRQTRRHSPSCVGRTRQTRRHLPSRVARTRQTREKQVWQVLCEFSESVKFGECRLDRFMHLKYVICA
jgi:hypothetical protein